MVAREKSEVSVDVFNVHLFYDKSFSCEYAKRISAATDFGEILKKIAKTDFDDKQQNHIANGEQYISEVTESKEKILKKETITFYAVICNKNKLRGGCVLQT